MSSGITISGAVSGLDTASLINQLVQLQQNQQTMLTTRQSKVQKTSDAYGSLITKLASLSTLSGDLQETSAWKGTTATSSSTTVTATTTSNISSSITFDVVDIARAHSLITTSTYASLNTVVADGSLTLHNVSTGADTNIAVGTGSLSDVVSAINASGSGYTAAAVQTGNGTYRLQVTAATTGEATEFTLGGSGTFPATSILTQGTDAQVHVGTGPGAYYATSTTNTFSSLVAGISFTVSKAGENGVTVSSGVDGSAIATKVQQMVDAANAVLTYINEQTAYNTTTKAAGSLMGESSVRALQQNILSAVSTAGAAGVHVTRNGTLTFNRTEFTAAYQADPAAVAAAFGATGTFARAAAATSTAVTLAGSTNATRAGSYAITVTTAAARGGDLVGHPARRRDGRAHHPADPRDDLGLLHRSGRGQPGGHGGRDQRQVRRGLPGDHRVRERRRDHLHRGRVRGRRCFHRQAGRRGRHQGDRGRGRRQHHRRPDRRRVG